MDFTNKIARLEVSERSFTPEGESRKVEYSRLVLTITVKGEEMSIDLPGKVSSELKALLKAADDLDA